MYPASKLRYPCPVSGFSRIISQVHWPMSSRPSADSFFMKYNPAATETAVAASTIFFQAVVRLRKSLRRLTAYRRPVAATASIPVREPDKTIAPTTIAQTPPTAYRIRRRPDKAKYRMKGTLSASIEA
ncbi:Uncharacterised protein [Alistipes sp. cv1]|nr:Uncharacterised protein [Faecalibacterium prausnitzii]